VKEFNAQMKREAEKLVARTTFGIQAHVREGMAEEKHGAKYGTHVASAPGESPAVDTGFLTNSIQVEVDGLQGVVGTNAEYAMHLEFGTVKMEPRPYFGPAFEDAKPEFERGLQELLK
jgi:HK97 gp10 family phage protein